MNEERRLIASASALRAAARWSGEWEAPAYRRHLEWDTDRMSLDACLAVYDFSHLSTPFNSSFKQHRTLPLMSELGLATLPGKERTGRHDISCTQSAAVVQMSHGLWEIKSSTQIIAMGNNVSNEATVPVLSAEHKRVSTLNSSEQMSVPNETDPYSFRSRVEWSTTFGREPCQKACLMLVYNITSFRSSTLIARMTIGRWIDHIPQGVYPQKINIKLCKYRMLINGCCPHILYIVYESFDRIKMMSPSYNRVSTEIV